MAASVNRERRVNALEQRKRSRRAIKIPLISADVGESSKDAIARYVAEHGPLEEVEDDEINVIVFIPVVPEHRR